MRHFILLLFLCFVHEIFGFARPKDLSENDDNLPYDDKEAFSEIMNSELQDASGLSDVQYQNYQNGLAALNFLAQNYFTGEVNPDIERPYILDTVQADGEIKATSSFLYEGDILLTPDQLQDVIASAQEISQFQGIDPSENEEREDNPRNILADNLKKNLQEEPLRKDLQEKSQKSANGSTVPKRNLQSILEGSQIIAGDSVPETERQSLPYQGVLTRNSFFRWRTPILYTIHSASGVDSNAVRAGVNLWQSLTCLEFQEVSSGSGDWIEFFKGRGCYSNVGRVGGKQRVSIGTGCTSVGIVAHEIGHALGFWHEQSRPDRDNYVSINSQNIQSGTLSNFLPKTASSVELYTYPYDFGSVMHYGRTAFALDYGKNTIVTKDENYQRTIGNRVGLSFYDVKFINTAYCSSSCSNSRLACQQKGYPDPKNCDRCRCPDGFSGQLCEMPESTTTDCGTINLQATGSFQTITQINTGRCNYLITAPAGRKVVLNLQSFKFWSSRTCSTSYVELKYTSDLANTGARICHGNPISVRSETNKAVVIYKGTFSNNFRLSYRMDPITPVTGGTTTTTPSTPAPTPVPITTTTTTTSPPPTTKTPEEIGWSLWSDWSSCSASCGACGSQLRIRRCLSSDSDCPGTWKEDRKCNYNPCPGSTPCCGELISKNNECVEEVVVVVTAWTNWGAWSFCTATCGACGVSTRRRICPSSQRSDCPGRSVEAVRCGLKACSGNRCCSSYFVDNGFCVSGAQTTQPQITTTTTTVTPLTTMATTTVAPSGWSEWDAWSSCSADCGACGIRTRRRLCRGGVCTGLTVQTNRCNFNACDSDEPCCENFGNVNGFCVFGAKTNAITTTTPQITTTPVSSGWSSWTPWSQCIGKDCGACGQKFRVRYCQETECSGASYERDACNIEACSNCGGDLIANVVCPDDETKFCPLYRGGQANCPCCAPFRIGSDQNCYRTKPQDPSWFLKPRK